MNYHVTLPLPPSSNHIYVRRAKVYYKNGKRKRRVMDVLSDRAQAWMASARDLALTAMGQWECPEKTKVVVEVMVYWPDRRRRDCHNLSKLLCDSLEGTVCKDDQYMLLRYMDFEIDKENPRVEVTAHLKEQPSQSSQD
jgi:crossover junction endodeoxyribonuclease RusA